MANHVVQGTSEIHTDSDIVFSPQQLEQILKLIPGEALQSLKSSVPDDEFDVTFSGMVTCNLAKCHYADWIVDSGASDHITGSLTMLTNVKAADNKCDIQFTPHTCNIIDSASQQTKAVGKIHNGLYYLHDKAESTIHLPSDAPACHAAVVDSNIWHLRLGHAPLSKLKSIPQLKSQLGVSDQTKIKCIRSDNAPEFSDPSCTIFYSSQGIVQQKTCVYRPQQNARAERKHRHILEVARSLRLQSGIPLSHWGDLVMTAVYLINRLPTPVLQNKTPYEMLYNEPADYNNLRAFGCLVFAPNPNQSADKFSFRAVPSVFIGYPPGVKGYKLLDLSTKQTFVSRDTVFHESVFPMNNNSTGSYVHPVPLAMPTPERSIPNTDDILVPDDAEPPPSPLLDSPLSEAASDREESESSSFEPSLPPKVLRRSDRIRKQPVWLNSYVRT
ncbi:uncharacterized protein LOC141665303 [Apium graveolens]|uniref:uncharacterized protein LOC141665303 n=1 Tax=Apium graveolens TaxID=4045 RepID=UPI003D78E808